MRFFYLILIFMCSGVVLAQETELRFPNDFYGIYKGDLQISNANGEQTVEMEFHLNKTDSVGQYNYTIVYIVDGKRQERLYTLIEKDSEKGDYVVDENNGILLDAKIHENTLYSIFEVQNNLITTTERFYKDSMDFVITFSNIKNKTKSGTEDETPIEVYSYPVGGVQKAHLIKQ